MVYALILLGVILFWGGFVDAISDFISFLIDMFINLLKFFGYVLGIIFIIYILANIS